MLSGVTCGPLAHTRGSVLDALKYQGRSPWLVRSQVDDRELRARHAVPLHFQAPNRSVEAQHAVPACTRPSMNVFMKWSTKDSF